MKTMGRSMLVAMLCVASTGIAQSTNPYVTGLHPDDASVSTIASSRRCRISMASPRG